MARRQDGGAVYGGDGDDVVDAVGGGTREGRFEGGELGGPGSDVCADEGRACKRGEMELV